VVAYGIVDPVDGPVVDGSIDDVDEGSLPLELGREGAVHALDLGLSQRLRVLSCHAR